MASFHEKFSLRLREALSEAGISQRHFSELMKTTTTTVQRWVNAQAWPSPDKIEEICFHLNKSPAWLMGGSDTEPTRAETVLNCIKTLSLIQDIDLAKQALDAILEGEVSRRPAEIKKL